MDLGHNKDLFQLPDYLTNKNIQKWNDDTESKESFREALTHLAWSYVFASAMAPIIEGLTMFLTEENPKRYLPGNFRRQITKVIQIVKTVEYFNNTKVRRQEFADNILKIGQIVSNIPLDKMEEFKNAPRELSYYLIERLKTILNYIKKEGINVLYEPEKISIEIANPNESNPMRIFDYILRKRGHYIKLRRLVYNLILNQPEIFDIFRKLPSTGFYEEPGIILPGTQTVPIDTLVNQTIGKSYIQGFEDFWGQDRALIFYHKLILDGFIHANNWEWYKTITKIVKERWDEKSDKINKWLETLQKSWDKEYKTTIYHINNYDETINGIFSVHIKLYTEMLRLAKKMNILNEIRMLSLLIYIHGHR